MKLPRYPEYKDSGVEWLGDVPSHWAISRIKHVLLRIGAGGTPSTDNPEFWAEDNGYAWVAIGDMSERGTIQDTAKKLTKAGVESKGLTIWPAGTLLFSMYASLGHVAELLIPAATNQAILSLLPRENTNQRFLKRWFEFLRPHLKQDASSNTQDNLNAEKVRNLYFLQPPLAEQTAIATFLDRETGKIDALIAEQEKLLTLLAEKRQATISHAVTKGLNPAVPMKDSGVEWLGEVPAHWGITRLKFVAVVQTGIAKGKDTTGKETITVPYLRVANVQDGYLTLDDIAMIDIEPEQLDRYRLLPGDVLMNEGGDFDKLGRGAIWNGEIQDCIHQNHVFAVRPHAIDACWLNQITSSQYAQFYFMGRSKQSTNLASISSTNIMELPVLMPPTDEQMDILAFINTDTTKLDTLTTEAIRAIELLKERRSALISAAVTGKIDVRQA